MRGTSQWRAAGLDLGRWVAGLALVLVAACGPDPADRRDSGDAASAVVHSDLYDLTGIPLSSDLAPAILAARGALDEAGPPSPYKALLERYERLDQDFWDHERRRAAEDSLLAWWGRDPQNFLWIYAVGLNRRDMRRQEDLQRIETRPPLADTTSCAGAFLAGVWSRRTEAAAGHFARARACWAQLDSLQRALLILEVGRHRRRTGRPLEGAEELLAHLPLARSVGGHGLAAHFWDAVTYNLIQADRLDDATHAAVMTWELARAGRYPHLEASAREDLATILAARREYQAARQLYEESVVFCREEGLAFGLQSALDRLASLMTTTGDFAAALAYDRQILDLLEASGQGHNLPGVLMNVANDHLYLGRPDSARAYMEQSMAAAATYGSARIQGAMMQRAAVCLTHFGEYERAEELLKQANALLSESGQSADMLHLQVEALREALKMGAVDLAYEALRWLRDYRGQILNRSPNENLEAQIEIASADLYRGQGEYRRAAQALERARAAIDRRPGTEWEWEYQRSLGRLSAARGDFERAAEAFDRCVSLAREVGNDDWLETSRTDLARALLETGRYEEARQAIGAVAAETRFGTRFRTRLEHHVLLGAALRREGKLAKARHHLEKGRDLLTRYSPADLAARLQVEYADWLAARGRPGEAADHGVQALEALDRSPELWGTAEGDEPRRAALELLVGLYRQHPALVPGGDPCLQTLGLLDRYWWPAAVVDTTPGPAAGPDGDAAPPARRLQGLLAGNTLAPGASGSHTVVVFLVGEKTSYRWIVGPGGSELAVLPARHELRRQMTPILQDLRTPGRSLDVIAFRSLSRQLLGPLLERWPAGTTLCVLPDDLLHEFPWAAVPLDTPSGDREPRGAQPRLLCDHGPVVQLASLTSAAPRGGDPSGAPPGGTAGLPDAAGSPVAAVPTLLGIGHNGPEAAGTTPANGPQLRHAEAEVRAIAALWPPGHVRPVLGRDARWHTVRELMTDEVDVIHLATHAVVYQSSRGQASIRLDGEDGQAVPVTLQSLRELSLSAQLVFLSCCEAAAPAGPHRRQADFAHVFLAAGAETVIASTQRIDDEAARFLAVRFYRHWLSGVGPAEALRRAQIETRDEHPPWRHPYYWATYRVIQGGL